MSTQLIHWRPGWTPPGTGYSIPPSIMSIISTNPAMACEYLFEAAEVLAPIDWLSHSELDIYLDFCCQYHLVDDRDLMWIISSRPKTTQSTQEHVFKQVHEKICHTGIIYTLLIECLITQSRWNLIEYLIAHSKVTNADLICLGEIMTPLMLSQHQERLETLMSQYPRRDEIWRCIWPQNF